MKVKCINNRLHEKELTLGAEYEILTETENSYLITDDRCVINAHLKNYFKVIVEDEIKLEDIVNSPIKGIKLNFLRKDYFEEEVIRKDTDHTIYIREEGGNAVAKVKPSEIPQLIEWLQKVNTYIGQVKNKTKEMTIEEIEKELGYKIKIVGVER